METKRHSVYVSIGKTHSAESSEHFLAYLKTLTGANILYHDKEEIYDARKQEESLCTIFLYDKQHGGFVGKGCASEIQAQSKKARATTFMAYRKTNGEYQFYSVGLEVTNERDYTKYAKVLFGANCHTQVCKLLKDITPPIEALASKKLEAYDELILLTL